MLCVTGIQFNVNTVSTFVCACFHMCDSVSFNIVECQFNSTWQLIMTWENVFLNWRIFTKFWLTIFHGNLAQIFWKWSGNSHLTLSLDCYSLLNLSCVFLLKSPIHKLGIESQKRAIVKAIAVTSYCAFTPKDIPMCHDLFCYPNIIEHSDYQM